VVANSDRRQDLCASSDVDMTADDGGAWLTPRAQRDLLKDETVYANCCVGMNDNSVRVRDQYSPANLTGEGYIGPGDNAPKAMAYNEPIAKNTREHPAPGTPILVFSDRPDQLAARVPESTRHFPAPIRDLCAKGFFCGHV